ncbi:hypothetical protein [Micropruina sp.]|uniref:hypothetical protein n=1 Tax=Micropruina sp. TaxID=2737536 RepID=UPI0039E4CE15
MPDKSERRAARAEVRTYHEAELTKLVARVGDAIDRHRAGELDAYDVDELLHHYSLSAKELWKFCNLGNVESTAHYIEREPPVDWWEVGKPRRR